MIMLNRKPMELEAAIRGIHSAKEELDHSWRMGEFGKMLRTHLHGNNGEKLIVQSPDPENYPRLRCYRGTVHKFELVRAIIYERETPPVVKFTVRTDWVEAGIDSFMESEGCPGAEVKTHQHDFNCPLSLVQNPTKKDFDNWVKIEVARQKKDGQKEAIAKIRELSKQFGIPVKMNLLGIV